MSEITGKHVLLKDKEGNYLFPETMKTNVIAVDNVYVPTSDAVSKAISAAASEKANVSHTHTTNQLVDFPTTYIVASGMANFTIDAKDGVMLTDDTLKKTYTGIYRKYNTGIYELYGTVPPIAQGVHSYHHLLGFPTGITFAKCPNTNNNDSTKFMYTLVATQAFDENEATYQQYAFLVDTQYSNRVKFSIIATSLQAGIMFHLIGKLA